MQSFTEDEAVTCQPVEVRSPANSFSSCPADMDNTEPASSSGSSPSTRLPVWPGVFPVPRFGYEAELQLEKANAEFSAGGTHLTPSAKLKSHLLERLSVEIITFKVHPTDSDLNEVAEALVEKHPCLREQGSFNGCYGWKISLKYKMANVQTKL